MSADPVVATPAVDSVRPRLEAARRDLLDLGLRNSLINFRPLKARGVEVVGESPTEVLRILVREGRRMTFQPAPEPVAQAPVQSGLPSLPQPVEPTAETIVARQSDPYLQTNETSERLQTRLLNSFYAARTCIEEQGVNILYLALGMLEWFEAPSSQESRRAPLLLVPVELERSNALDRFRLQHTGEDIGDNLSLAAKLETEFGVVAPPLLELEDLDLDVWFDAFEQAVAEQLRWSVDRSAIALGFFSFGKFLMYHDLDAATWPEEQQPDAHPLIHALLDTDGFREPPSTIADDAFLDPLIDPATVHQVVDADASQTLAILDVKAGRNLVIQGPPGTGKSQTITNLIAEAIGAGKSVLFVAEKMAALEVVKRRLDSVGLGDACLELHSHKINKRSVLHELRRTLELGQPKVAEAQAQLALLEDSRERLNAYCDAVNTPIGESGVTPYLAYGTLIQTRQNSESETWPRFEIAEMALWPQAEYVRREAIVREMQSRLAGMGVPVQHPFWGSTRTLILPTERERLRENLASARSELDELCASSDDLARALGLTKPADLPEVEQLSEAARWVLDAPDLTGIPVSAPGWATESDAIRELLAAGARYAEIHASRDAQLIPEAWNQDVLPVRTDLAAFRDKWWRGISGTYRRARSMLAGLCASEVPKEIDDQIQLVDDILEASRQLEVVQRHDTLGRDVFGALWLSDASDWSRLTTVSEWLLALRAEMTAGRVPEGLLAYLSGNPNHSAVGDARIRLTHAASAMPVRLESLANLLAFDATLRFGQGATLAGQSFAVLDGLLRAWTERTDSISDLVAFNSSVETLRSERLEEVALVARAWPGAAISLVSALRKGRATLLLEHALQERPALAQFDVSGHEQVIERFRALDQLAFRSNRARLAYTHWSKLPTHEAGGQLGVLRREFEKKSRHLPVRRLMERAGNAVQAIKPVFMMSPLSIATYIPPGTLTFDLVIFDEASQVKPVDSFGALLRGRQAVVVGDSKQLPPTSFFDRMMESSESDEDDGNVTSDLESVLGLFSAQSAPSRMLRWHYRSRHESLIAVSNHEFYEDRLIVFPSPDASRRDAGLHYHHLPETTYDRGGTRTNKDEAVAVAQAVMKHARTDPQLTLGVAAFSVAQSEAILAQIELLRRGDPSCETFFSAHPEEPFFVKNLENVQGDERDVIFISVGYGRTADGYVAMSFGPLNNDGGERRLNVLITRARLRCEIFTNLTADDIDLRRSNARGVHALKQYLKYAQTGILDIPIASGRESGSPFEDAVRDKLEAIGYQIEGQVGSAGFFIDLAVIDPQQPGRYLLGIECDGATYHSARSARDRDRLRQQVLEGLGWRIHRVWSTDWFRNPEREMQRLVEAIERTRAMGGPDIPDPVSRATTIERVDAQPIGSAAGGASYRVATPRVQLNGLELHKVPPRTVAEWVVEIINIESPVHVDEVTHRVADAAGVGRVGNRIRATLDAGIDAAIAGGAVRRQGAFLWSYEMRTPVVRDRSALSASARSLERVAPEEVEAAVEQAVRDAYGLQPDQVAGAACALLGFSRVTEDMRSTIAGIVDVMVASGRLLNHGLHLTAP